MIFLKFTCHVHHWLGVQPASQTDSFIQCYTLHGFSRIVEEQLTTYFFFKKCLFVLVDVLMFYCTEIVEMNTFENYNYFYIMKEVTPLTIIIFACLHINLVYMETLSFVCCKNITFHIKTLVFQILCTIFGFFYEGIPFSQGYPIFPAS